jgi:sugar/nucleoside kinase (ribokinase family)
MAAAELDLLCIGNALVDIFMQGNEDTACRYGITGPVQHVEIEKLQEIISGVHGYTAVSGGGAANVAKIAALLGLRAGFIGALGKDAKAAEPDRFGRLFRESLSTAGVELTLPLKAAPTGICLLLGIGNETRIAASPSAALGLSEDDIRGEDIEIERTKIVVIDGFILGRQGLVRHILRLTEQYGKTAAIDLGSPSIAGEHAAEIVDYARQYSLVLFMNEEEARAFYEGCGSPPVGEGSPFRRLCLFFRAFSRGNLAEGNLVKPFLNGWKHGPPVIVVKLGKRGAIAFAGGGEFRAKTQPMVPHETTGAGDTFCAAFLSAWVRDKMLSECVAMGNKAARVILGVAGTGADRESFKELAGSLSVNSLRL